MNFLQLKEYNKNYITVTLEFIIKVYNMFTNIIDTKGYIRSEFIIIIL